MTDDAVFEHMNLYFIISYFLSPLEIEHLKACNILFHRFHTILHHTQPEIVYKLFQCDKDYASQQSIPKERRLQFIFLSLVYRMCMPSMMWSLTGNYTASCRDLEQILWAFSDALQPERLRQLSRVLHHHNHYKFKEDATSDQRKQIHAYGNHSSVGRNLIKVEKTLNKEERNKHVAAFPCWLERFFPDMFLTPQCLVCKEGKKDNLVFDGSFMETPFSICINAFTSTKDEITLHYGTVMTRHLVRTHNIRMSYHGRDILLFDGDAAGNFFR